MGWGREGESLAYSNSSLNNWDFKGALEPRKNDDRSVLLE